MDAFSINLFVKDLATRWGTPLAHFLLGRREPCSQGQTKCQDCEQGCFLIPLWQSSACVGEHVAPTVQIAGEPVQQIRGQLRLHLAMRWIAPEVEGLARVGDQIEELTAAVAAEVHQLVRAAADHRQQLRLRT